jgi:transposase
VGVKRRSFDPEFRAGAVRIVRETGKPVAEVARDLGINAYTLHNWVKADRESGGQGAGAGLNESEREELARLRAQKAQRVFGRAHESHSGNENGSHVAASVSGMDHVTGA